MVTWSKWVHKHFPQLAESLRFTYRFKILYKNDYTVRTTQIFSKLTRIQLYFAIVPFQKAYHKAIWFSGKGLKERERERERDLKSTAADRNSATIFHINAIKWKRPFYWCFGYIYGCLCGFFLQMLVLRSWIFRIVSDSASSFFIALRSSWLWIFWNFQKITQEKAWWSLGLLMLQRGVFRTQTNNYDGALLRKSLTAKIH